MSELSSVRVISPSDKEEECALFTIDDGANRFVISDVTVPGNEYTFSCWLRSEPEGAMIILGERITTTVDWQKYVKTFTATDVDIAITYDSPGAYNLLRTKLELGNRATDWTPAPEDTQDRISIAESAIELLKNSISMLVTDGNGGSLMTQTKDGWTFNIAATHDQLEDVRSSLNDLQKATNDTESAVDALEGSINEFNNIAPYVRIITDDGKPCIELGGGESDFKLLITNTDIRFMEGSSNEDAVAYISNQSLNITKAVIKEELQQGGFVWTVRSNNNMGLMWKGVGN